MCAIIISRCGGTVHLHNVFVENDTVYVTVSLAL